MLMIVSANPMLLTMVSPVATKVGEDDRATIVDSCGLSGMTNIPQHSKTNKNKEMGMEKLKGMIKQQMPEPKSAKMETHLLLFFPDR